MKNARLAVRAAFFALAAVLGGIASAHDFWLEPASFTAVAGRPIDLSIKVGTGADVEVLPWMPVHVERCFATDGATTLDVESETDRLPAATFALPTPGTWTVAYDSFDSRVELEPAKFEAYLRDEGLESIIEQRKTRGESDKKSRELFSRCAKALIRVVPAPGAPAAQASSGSGVKSREPSFVRLPLEIVAEADPYVAKPGDRLAFRLYLRGAPLEGALLQAKRLDHSGKLAARSDADGRVEFDLGNGRAAWMITAVHMERAQKRSNAEWKSFWATLTFEMMDRGVVTTVSKSGHEGKS